MANFKEIFTRQHTLLPVIHVETPQQTLHNANIAYEAGCDGIFLISMRGLNYKDLLEMHKVVRQEFATWWIGVNFLDLRTVSVFSKLNSGISGVWADNAEIYDWLDKQVKAEAIIEAKKKSDWKGLYFGGVAFKYQHEVDNLALAAEIATEYMDVVTTSGDRTGYAPPKEKIAIMKAAIGNFPLAVASGISPDNVQNYLQADCFLVSTSLLIPGTEKFDPSRVKALVEAVRT